MGLDSYYPTAIALSAQSTPRCEVVSGGSRRPVVAARHAVRLRLAIARLAFRSGLSGSAACLSRKSPRSPGREPAVAGSLVSSAGLLSVVSLISVQFFHTLKQRSFELRASLPYNLRLASSPRTSVTA
jgi:hypothetical protein